MIHIISSMDLNIDNWDSINYLKSKIIVGLTCEMGFSKIKDIEDVKEFKSTENYILFFPENFRHPIQQFLIIKDLRNKIKYENLFVVTNSPFILDIIVTTFRNKITFLFADDNNGDFTFKETTCEKLYLSFAHILQELETMDFIYNPDDEEANKREFERYIETLTEKKYREYVERR